MKIGILTFHVAHNYGAVLQCYALKHYLCKLGHDVYIIDYRPEYITNEYKWLKRSLIIRKNVIKSISELCLLNSRKKKYDSFEVFQRNYFSTAPVDSINQDFFNLIIIGSDQVWNFNITNGFDTYYWGNFERGRNTKLASYAASMQDKWEKKESAIIKSNLKNFDYISVRENPLRVKIQDLATDKIIYRVLDPTLLLQQEDWDEIAQKPQISVPYLFLYQVEKSYRAFNIAQRIAKDRNLKLITLSAALDNNTSKDVRSASPEEFLGLFKYSDFVVCSSFHGTIFSIQFKRPFISIKMNKGKDDRVKSLLEPIGLLGNFIDDYDSQKDYNCDYNIESLDSLRKESYKYIQLITE